MPGDARIRQLRAPLVSLTLTVLVSGCQGFSVSSATSPQADPMVGAPPITRGLDAEGLSTLLVAELAGQRGDYRRATEGYLRAAERYDSPALGERATLAARFADDPQLLQRAAQRWQTLSPEAAPAAQVLGNLAGSRGDWPEALRQRLIADVDGTSTDITRFVDTALSTGADPSALATPLRDHLSRPALAPEARRDAELAMLLIRSTQGDTELAQRELSRLKAQADDMAQYWLVASRLAFDRGATGEARTAARRGLAMAPGDPRFLLLMARADIRLGNLTSAEANTDALLEERDNDPLLRIGLAQLYLEEDHLDPARRLLTPLVGEADAPPAAYMLLGAIAEQENDVDNALLYYRQVPEGPDFLLSRQRSASLLIEADRLLDARAFLRVERLRHDAAYSDLVMLEIQLLDAEGYQRDADALLNRELARVPDDGELRYYRAMRAWQAGDTDTSESDLRRLVEQQPDNANALNALGYTLADEGDPDRLDEAAALIQRAYTLDPNNPAVQDSLGWVAYRRGDLTTALRWIEQAWRALPDQEVAAHLIEVLWELGRKERAREILAVATEQFPERPLIDALLDRRPGLAP
ncbi:tetratricopeptide repeat protein [Halomonas sp. V046]|uniref:tetratricopeptide repeat protein n=1 Tax=Halomonas sp. V046 TaxID=3459611 RepID=UPI0040439EE9